MKRPSTGRRWTWVFLGAGAYGLHLAAGKDSAVVENIYSRGLFVGVRWLWDMTLGRSPVPLLPILIGLLILRGAWALYRRKKSRGLSPDWRRPSQLTPEEYRSDIYVPSKSPTVPTRIGRGLLAVGSWAGMFVLFFYLLWGFNYGRIGVEKQLRLEVQALDLSAVRAEAEETVRALTAARSSIPGASKAALGDRSLPAGLEDSVRRSLSKILADLGFPVTGRPRVRPFRPGGLLMRLSSTGFYCPYCGEGYTADNLTAAERPFVAAHEMVHAYGLTDEGAANFLGFLACSASDLAVVRYSGLLAYWEYVFPELARLSRDEARSAAARLPEGAGADLRASYENWQRYRGPVRAAAEAVYERYLKSQGIKEGLKSYDRFVSLVAAWKRSADGQNRK